MKNAFLLLLIILASCQSNQETTKPVIQDITESVYASGFLVSKDQYNVFSVASGIVDKVFVDEGSTVEIGSPILSLVSDAQKLMNENAELSFNFNALNFNKGKLSEAISFVGLTKTKMENDSTMLKRQKSLWSQNIGSKVELESAELAFKNAQVNYKSAIEKLHELEKQLHYLSKQAHNNLLISNKSTDDYLIKSKLKGKIYQLDISVGEIVTPQVPIAIIGNDTTFILEMQIDEYDIVIIKLGMPVLVVLNSYKDSVFSAKVSKINPIMNLQSKTFTIEAELVRPPKVLYPNISFEANVLISTKKDALLIPRNYLLNDSFVVNKSGKQLIVKTGLKDYQMVEILSGIDANEEIILPE